MAGYRFEFPQGTNEHMRKLLETERDPSVLRRVQCVYFRSKYGFLPERIADMTGFSLGTVRNLHCRFRREGVAALEIRPRGGRHHSYMTVEQEEAFLAPFFQEAARGGVLEVGRIHSAYEQAVGRKVYRPTVYSLLHRHGWRKIAPRPSHPKHDAQAAAAFKKTSGR